jgi:hypothetical protein
MIFVAGVVLAALIASLTVTSRGKADKNAVAVSAQSMKQSPKKKNLVTVCIKQEDMNQNQNQKKPSYHFKILKLKKPDIKLIWIDAMPGNDGYAQDLFNHITDENGFREFGLLIVARRRVNQATNEELKNTRNSYARRCIVRALDGPSTPESRLAVLHAFQLFVSCPEFNKYDYDYVVDHESDLTPEDDAMKKPMPIGTERTWIRRSTFLVDLHFQPTPLRPSAIPQTDPTTPVLLLATTCPVVCKMNCEQNNNDLNITYSLTYSIYTFCLTLNKPFCFLRIS